MIRPEANSEAYAPYENALKASPFHPQRFLWVGKERLFLLHLPLSKRDARPLAPQGEKALLRKPSAAAQGLRVCARWAFLPVSAGSKQSAGLPLVDRALTCLWQVDGGAALPRSDLGHGSELVPRGFAFCAAVLRSRPWGLCPQTSATFVKGEGRRVLASGNVQRPSRADRRDSGDDETFGSRSFASHSLWLFCPRVSPSSR